MTILALLTISYGFLSFKTTFLRAISDPFISVFLVCSLLNYSENNVTVMETLRYTGVTWRYTGVAWRYGSVTWRYKIWHAVNGHSISHGLGHGHGHVNGHSNGNGNCNVNGNGHGNGNGQSNGNAHGNGKVTSRTRWGNGKLVSSH